jgi:hypothetical protein
MVQRRAIVLPLKELHASCIGLQGIASHRETFASVRDHPGTSPPRRSVHINRVVSPAFHLVSRGLRVQGTRPPCANAECNVRG